MLEFLSDYTLQNVIIGSALLGLISGTLGCFAVLRKQSLLGDALSHAALPGICIGFLVSGSRNMGAILLGALIAGSIAAILVLIITRNSRIKSDSALGIVLSSFFALGLVLLTYIQAQGDAAQGGLQSFLFGQAAAILRSDLWLMGGITFGAIALVILLWKEFKIISFDIEYAKTNGLPTSALEILLTIMIALAVVVGLQMVGVVLMAAMIIAPAASARQWTNNLGPMVILAAALGIVAGVSGSIISATGSGLSTGPLIVIAISIIFGISLFFAPQRGIFWDTLRLHNNRKNLEDDRVLITLFKIANEHDNPNYPAEKSMLDSYFGHSTHAALQALASEKLVTQVIHEPEVTEHWALTFEGYKRAANLLNINTVDFAEMANA